MKLLLLLSLLCIHNASRPPQEKQKADTVKKMVKPVKKAKTGSPLYPSFLIVDIY